MQRPDELRTLVEGYVGDLALTPELHGQAESVRYALVGGKRVRGVICLATAEAAGAGRSPRSRPLRRSSSCTRSRSSTTICLRSTTTTSGAAAARPGRSSARRWRFSPATRCSRRRSGSRSPTRRRCRAGARRGDARDDRRAVPRHHGHRADCATLHRLKTGRLFAASVGCALGRGDAGAEQAPWRAFGEELGLLFQIVDDILDGDGYVLEHGRVGGATLADAAAARARERLADVPADTSALAESSPASQFARRERTPGPLPASPSAAGRAASARVHGLAPARNIAIAHKGCPGRPASTPTSRGPDIPLHGRHQP